MRMDINSDIFDADITVYSWPMKDDLINMGKDIEDNKKEWKFEIRSDTYGWACRLIYEKGNYGEEHWVCGGRADTRMPTMLARSVKTIGELWIEKDE